jgi:hypothetical protein
MVRKSKGKIAPAHRQVAPAQKRGRSLRSPRGKPAQKAIEPGEGGKAIVPNDPDTVRFVKGLVERGEAASCGADGKLPPGATHEIVGTAANGLPIVVRRRFSAI